MSVSASSSWFFGDYVSEIARCRGTSVWGVVCRSCFSIAIPFTFLFTRSPSDVVPVAILPSSFFFYPDRAEQFPKLSHSVWLACIPGCQRCHLRLNGPVQEIEENIQRQMSSLTLSLHSPSGYSSIPYLLWLFHLPRVGVWIRRCGQKLASSPEPSC